MASKIGHALALVVLVGSALARPARADLVLDQSHQVTTPQFDAAVVSSQSLAQTFTVGTSGLLSLINLQIFKTTGTTGDLLFSVRSTAAGVPNVTEGESLFQSTIALSSIPTSDTLFADIPFTSIDVSSANIQVASSQVLAISLSRTGAGSPPWALWRASTNPGYAGGGGFVRPGTSGAWSPIGGGYDLGFQTFVNTAAIPEPSPAVLAVVGGTLTLAVGRRRAAA